MKKSIFVVIIAALICSVLYFQYQYYKHYPRRFSGVWQYGYEELIDYVTKQTEYDKIYDAGYWGRPYVYYLFYTKTDPRAFRETMKVTRDRFGFVEVEGFDRYIFTRQITEEIKTDKALYVVKTKEVPSNAKEVKVIRTIDGIPQVSVYTH